MNKILIALVLAVGLSENILAKTLETNIEGIVIKGMNCYYSICEGTIINRTNDNLKNIGVTLNLFDRDDDPIGQCYVSVYLADNSGKGFTAKCNNKRKVRSVKVKISRNDYERILGIN